MRVRHGSRRDPDDGPRVLGGGHLAVEDDLDARCTSQTPAPATYPSIGRSAARNTGRARIRMTMSR